MVPTPPSRYETQAYSLSRSASLFASARTHEELNLAQRADQLAKTLGEAKSDPDRAKIKTELSEVLEKQFDLRQKRHLDEIKSLEAKVKKLKELVDKRQENRREIVSKRLDQITERCRGIGLVELRGNSVHRTILSGRACDSWPGRDGGARDRDDHDHGRPIVLPGLPRVPRRP